jgi:hypothetical protein
VRLANTNWQQPKRIRWKQGTKRRAPASSAAATANLAPKIRDPHFKRQNAVSVFIAAILLEITISFGA